MEVQAFVQGYYRGLSGFSHNTCEIRNRVNKGKDIFPYLQRFRVKTLFLAALMTQ